MEKQFNFEAIDIELVRKMLIRVSYSLKKSMSQSYGAKNKRMANLIRKLSPTWSKRRRSLGGLARRVGARWRRLADGDSGADRRKTANACFGDGIRGREADPPLEPLLQIR